MIIGRRATVLGWDIGGVNTKVARVTEGRLAAVVGRPFEIQHDPSALVELLRALAADVGVVREVTHAVTMTAELSQIFRTKRDGVSFVLDAVEEAFESSAVRVYTVDGRFISLEHGHAEALAVAAANWAATARVVALSHPDALLIDIGTTTADIIPIVGGTVAAIGSTDPDRLASGELVYTGALRTSVEAIASHVPFGNGMAGVSAESFALAGDVHVWRGDLAPADYTVTAPDRRPPTREFAGERLARAICADREMLDDAAVTRIADALAASQDALVAGAIRRVRARHPGLHTAVVTGLGAFIAARAARAAGLDVVELSYDLGDAAARCAPAASVALLLDAELTRGSASPRARVHVQQPPSRTSRVDLVVKVGGGLLAGRNHLAAVLAAVADAAARARVLVVPGGGPFADTVRQVDRSLGLSDAAAHWMAILAMDQYAHLLADRLPDNRIVTNAGEVVDALAGNHIPILSPTHWLRAADPLPHSWDVTSDSIAAWVSEQLAAARLVLVKPPAAEGGRILDEYFMRARPNNLEVIAVPGDQIDRLRLALSGAMPGRKTGHYD